MTPPARHWRRHGTDPLPTGAEALDEPFNAFPSWFLRITCARCGQERMVNQVHAAKSDLPLRDILATRGSHAMRAFLANDTTRRWARSCKCR